MWAAWLSGAGALLLASRERRGAREGVLPRCAAGGEVLLVGDGVPAGNAGNAGARVPSSEK